MIDARMLDDVMKRLDTMGAPAVRRDYRVTAQLAARVISDLTKGSVDDTRRLSFVAHQIQDRATVRPQVVYRTMRTGEIRWLSEAAATTVRIKPEQVIGHYNAGANWRDILADLQA